MNALDVLSAALGALRGNQQRTGLSLLGMSIGVAAVLVLSGLGQGARDYLRLQFEFIGSDVVGVLPGKVETSGGIPGFGGVPNALTISDAEALARALPRVERVSPVAIGTETIACGSRSRQIVVLGGTEEALAIRKLQLRAGSFLPAGDWQRGARVVVLGSKLARELLPGENPLGAIVRIGGWRMRVIGVLASQGVRFGMNLDETVYVPVATALAMFDKDSLFRIVLQVRPGADIEGVSERVSAVLRERHGEEDFTITTPDAILSSLDSILSMLTLALAGIASISLCVAGIGIMNVMLVSVSERTEEIGLEKAIGAEPSQVLTLFVTEAALLSALGATLGLAVGQGLVHVAGVLFPSFPLHVPPWAAVAAFALSVIVGVTFGIWPAARAVRLDPVAALSGRAR